MKSIKSLLRKELQRNRSTFHVSLSEKEYTLIHLQIAAHLKLYVDTLDQTFQSNLIVGAFSPIKDEVDCLKVLEHANLGQKTKVCLPVHFKTSDKKPLEFREMSGKLKKGEYGIDIPEETAEILTPNFILTPFLGFDDDTLHRIGYGGGHFDRTIAMYRQKNRGLMHKFVGIGFECQRFPMIPVDDHDMPLDVIITESRIYLPK